MRFEVCSWMQVEDYLKVDNRVMLVLGACEQHGYLSLLADVKTPMALADAASESSGVLVAPVVNFGCSPYFLAHPGTISLRLNTYISLVEDIIRSLYGAGFRKILILNGHGGNTSIKTHLVELINQLPDLRIRWYSWWTEDRVKEIAKKYGLNPQHANWLEAFDFTTIADLPAAFKPLPQASAEILGKARARELYGDGSFGGQYQVEPAIMQEMFEVCREDIVDLLRFT
jgi:creatinine amidohydrolase